MSTLMKNMAVICPCCHLQFLEIFFLDDRPVRESERKASQLHFASEDSLVSKENFSAALTVGRYTLMRFHSERDISLPVARTFNYQTGMCVYASCP